MGWFVAKEKGNDIVDENPLEFDLVYSQGGSGGDMGTEDAERLVSLEEKAQWMHTSAISYASSLGIHLRPGVSTYGRGDCIFEACVDQFLRPEFENLIGKELEPLYWRNKVADLVEENLTAYQLYRMVKSRGGGSKKQQWAKDWVKLRQPGQFQCQAGDLLILGLATILHKNILVFNTHCDAPKPVTVHLASTLGGSVTTDIPIILCYDKEHYEGLLPVAIEDQNNTIKLLKQYSPKSKKTTLSVICPIPGKELEVNMPDFSGSMPQNIIKSQVTVSGEVPDGEMLLGINDSPPVVQSTSSGFMPQNTTRDPLSTSPPNLHLINYGENLCFSNSVVQLLTQTEIRSFLLTAIPTQPNPNMAVAQELARIYRARTEQDTTANLCR